MPKTDTMHKVFVDTNVIFEHALMRTHYRDAVEVFKLAEDKKIECFCSASCFYTLSYILRKKYSDSATRTILRQYLSFLSILPTDHSQLSSALSSSFKDIEDAFQYYTALGSTSYFITLNKKDFTLHRTASLEIYTPGEFLEVMG